MTETKNTNPATPRSVAAERREYERRTLEAEIGVYSESNFYTGFSEDISEGGIFVSTYELRPIGSLVKVEFVLPDGHEVSCKGEVRWVKDPTDAMDDKPGMGIRFEELASEHLAAIQEFVANREPLFLE
jgi:uncharacterized protein (TIGR02266 family)